MAAIRSKNTKPEMVVRRGLHARGLRFRLHDSQILGKPDLVFPSKRVVVFVNGCFWHAHQNCRNFKLPQTNTLEWFEKLEGNRERDNRNHEALRQMGWRVIIVWECSVRGKTSVDISSFLDELALSIGKNG